MPDDENIIRHSIKRKKKLIIRVIIIALILFFMIFSDYGFLTSVKLWWNIVDLKDKIATEQKLNDSLESRINVLLTDSLEMERIAREHYGMIKSGEKVYIILKK